VEVPYALARLCPKRRLTATPGRRSNRIGPVHPVGIVLAAARRQAALGWVGIHPARSRGGWISTRQPIRPGTPGAGYREAKSVVGGGMKIVFDGVPTLRKEHPDEVTTE
jgi:hypothetical protein